MSNALRNDFGDGTRSGHHRCDISLTSAKGVTVAQRSTSFPSRMVSRKDRYQHSEGRRPAMNVVDSSAWLEYLSGSARSRYFAGPIESTHRLLPRAAFNDALADSPAPHMSSSSRCCENPPIFILKPLSVLRHTVTPAVLKVSKLTSANPALRDSSSLVRSPPVRNLQS